MTRILMLCPMASAMAFPMAAHAAGSDAGSATPATTAQVNADRRNDDPSANVGRWHSLLGRKTDVVVGAEATYAPRYPGSDKGWVQALPALSVQRGVLFADTTRGVGLQFMADSGFYVSQSIYYDMGRLDRDSNWRPGSHHLAGMGDVPGSVTARTLIVQQFTPWLSASAEAEFALRDSARRNRYRAGMEFGVLKAEHDDVLVNVDTWWGDRRYNQAYFGVTSVQAARTGFAVSTPGSGLYAWSLGATWEHRFDPHWSSTLSLTGTRYAGEVGDSPVVSSRTAIGGTIAIAYSY